MSCPEWGQPLCLSWSELSYRDRHRLEATEPADVGARTEPEPAADGGVG
jgi:hypothetical protein